MSLHGRPSVPILVLYDCQIDLNPNFVEYFPKTRDWAILISPKTHPLPVKLLLSLANRFFAIFFILYDAHQPSAIYTYYEAKFLLFLALPSIHPMLLTFLNWY